MAQIKKQTNWCNINSSKDLETRSKNPTRKVHLVKFHKHLLFFKNEPFTASFSLFSSFQYSWQENVQYKFLQMTWFKPRTSGTGIDHSTNWVTTTAPKHLIFWQMLKDHFVRKRCLNVCKKWREINLIQNQILSFFLDKVAFMHRVCMMACLLQVATCKTHNE